MKKKNKIIIGIALIVVAIIIVIVGIAVNNHQKTIKEAEAISVSVETSENDLISDYQKQYQTIISSEYKTEAEYDSAKKSLSALKDEIEKSDIKDNETIISLIKDIDNAIKDYDDKIISLTTTELTTEETTEKVTEKETTKSNSESGLNNTTKSTPRQTTTETTTKKVTTTQTTTKKTYKDPAHGYCTYSWPDPEDYSKDRWRNTVIKYTWYESEGDWGATYVFGSSTSEADRKEIRKYAGAFFPCPNRDGKYDGEQVSSELIHVWLG